MVEVFPLGIAPIRILFFEGFLKTVACSGLGTSTIDLDLDLAHSTLLGWYL